MQIYDGKFFDRLPDDPLQAISMVLQEFAKFDSDCIKRGAIRQYYGDYVAAYTVLQTIGEAFGFEVAGLAFSDNKDRDIEQIRSRFAYVQNTTERIARETTIQNTRNRLLGKFPSLFAYTFTDGDLQRIQAIVNELREQISTATYFAPDHKARLLKKLEGLQAELHKRVSSLDRIWGFIGDAGIALGKFGTDAKPIFDRAREMAEIAWRTQAKAEELESGTPFPLLSPPKDDDKS